MNDFLVNSFLPFAILAALIIAGAAWIIRIVIFFYLRFTDRQSKSYAQKETMGLPKGAMRTFLALSFTALAAIALLNGNELIDLADKKWILGELGIIITFYFGSKAVETYVDSRAKIKAIEAAKDADQAIKVYKAIDEVPERKNGNSNDKKTA